MWSSDFSGERQTINKINKYIGYRDVAWVLWGKVKQGRDEGVLGGLGGDGAAV